MTSYYGRRWYPRRRRYYSHQTTGDTPRSTSPYWKSLQFVRAEFFRLGPFTFERFSDFYAGKYGSGAKQYMRRTFPQWQSGATKMAGQTERRILECVPPFLPKDKQFELLSFQVPSVIHQQKSGLKASRIKASEIETTYRQLAATVSEHEYNLDWFVNAVFPAKEVTEFLNVFKFTMLDCLRLSYAQVRQDLMLMHDMLPGLDGSIHLAYKIALLDCPVEVDVYPPPGAAQLAIAMSEPSLVTQFRDRYRTILLDHALAQCKAEAVGHVNRQVALADVESVVAQLQRTSSDQEYDTTLEVQGHGGTLTIRLQKKNLLRLRYAIAQQTMKLLFALGLTGVAVVFLCIKGLWPILIYVGIIPLGIIGSIWGKLQELKSEVTEYERKRATRLAAS
ncbi:MAG: hypothetical protein KJ626_08360 [Verrucomicrobia bacterium]|nr:hypothetical protein [Verrucomicrobiota bacterium]